MIVSKSGTTYSCVSVNQVSPVANPGNAGGLGGGDGESGGCGEGGGAKVSCGTLSVDMFSCSQALVLSAAQG